MVIKRKYQRTNSFRDTRTNYARSINVETKLNNAHTHTHTHLRFNDVAEILACALFLPIEILLFEFELAGWMRFKNGWLRVAFSAFRVLFRNRALMAVANLYIYSALA